MKDPKIKYSIDGTSISLEEAMERTNNWRQAMKPLYGNDITKVPKGFVIPMEDIIALAEKYRHNEIAGVRAYFALLGPKFEGEVRAVLVPVQLLPTETGMYWKDLIITNAGKGDDDSSIYDFTKPCPPSCDAGSELI